MRVLEIPLEEKLGEGRPYLTAYLQDRMPADPEGYGLPAVMVCPGGGYTHLSPREAEPIALAFAAAGYQAFVLYYSLQPEKILSAATPGCGEGDAAHSSARGGVECGSGESGHVRIFRRGPSDGGVEYALGFSDFSRGGTWRKAGTTRCRHSGLCGRDDERR